MLKVAIPVPHISSSERAADFYCKRLGFDCIFAYHVDDRKPDPCYLCLMRGGVKLHVSSFSGDGLSGEVANFLLDDVDALHAEFVARGVRISLEPTDQT